MGFSSTILYAKYAKLHLFTINSLVQNVITIEKSWIRSSPIVSSILLNTNEIKKTWFQLNMINPHNLNHQIFLKFVTRFPLLLSILVWKTYFQIDLETEKLKTV